VRLVGVGMAGLVHDQDLNQPGRLAV